MESKDLRREDFNSEEAWFAFVERRTREEAFRKALESEADLQKRRAEVAREYRSSQNTAWLAGVILFVICFISLLWYGMP